MRTFVKVSWEQNDDDQWYADLVLTDEHNTYRRRLVPGKALVFEISDERRCTGYTKEPGERIVCPEYQRIDTGSQCDECRYKDYYRDYVTGQKGLDTTEDFSVYLAQCGEAVKVGVTKSSRLERRWVEQGADYAVELYGALNSDQALNMEERISEDGLAERIRKEQKVSHSSCRLEEVMAEHGFAGDIIDIQERTVYPDITCSHITRTGRFSGEITSVKGSILFNDRMAMILTSGKVMQLPQQQGLDDY